MGKMIFARRTYLALLIAVCAVLFSTTARANWAQDLWNRDKLTGDWGGLRTDLSEKGVDIDLRLSQYWQRVASGGANVNSEYGGTMDYRLTIDTHKLLGTWEGLSINMHVRSRFGDDVNADTGPFAFQNTGMLMQSPGDFHGTDLTGLTATQYFPLFGKPASVTVGMFDIIDTVSGFFPGMDYGQEGFWNVNGLITALPWFGAVRGLSLYGGLLMTINEKYKLPESGILALGTKNESTSMGSVSSAFEDGTWLAAFHRFYWEVDEKMGYVMLFAGGSTRDQPSNEEHDFYQNPGEGIQNDREHKPWDVAVYIYQVFWQAEGNPDRFSSILIGGTYGPDNPQFAQWHAFAAVETFGLFGSRPNDRMGVSGWYNGLSRNFVKLTSNADIRMRDLWGMEVYYNYQINKWLHFSPDLQLIRNSQTRDDFAIVPGFRMVVDF
jgi:porin